MIRGWFVRLAIGIAILGVVVWEAASPSLVRVQLDGVAGKAAFEARLEYERSPNFEKAKEVADKEAKGAHAVVEKFAITPDDGVQLTLYRRAKSLVVYRWDEASDYYDVRVSAESKRGERS